MTRGYIYVNTPKTNINKILIENSARFNKLVSFMRNNGTSEDLNKTHIEHSREFFTKIKETTRKDYNYAF